MANPTWTSRDLPVLDTVVSLLDQDEDPVRKDQIADRTGLTPKEVQLALAALSSPPSSFLRLASNQDFGDSIDYVFGVTHEARRVVGAWPTAENVASALLDRLEQLANDEDASEDNRSRARRMLDVVADGGGSVLTGVLTSVLTAQMGL